MSCELDISDIVDEMAKGPTTAVGNLPDNQVAGVLTAVIKTVDQSPAVITVNGLGSYGLSVSNLQLIGVVKKGFVLSLDELQCPGAFTGKNNIDNVDDLLTNEQKQQQAMNETIIATVDNLKAQGIVTGNETDEELASIAGLASKFSPAQIKDYLLGKFDALGSVISDAMAALSALAAAGALIVALKNADILGKLKGFGAKIASIPELLSDTIDTADIDVEVDKLVGVPQVPSATTLAGELPKAPALPGVPAIPGVPSFANAANKVTGQLPSISPKDYIL